MVETQFSQKIKVVRSDNGKEFDLQEFYASKGVIHQLSCVETPQQNAIAERKHQHILNVARSVMLQAELPLHFWGESILTAVYLINRMPTRILNGISPFQKLYCREPNYKDLKVFGCLCYAATLRRDRDKFQARGRKCIFLGYPFGIKGYKLYCIDTGNVIVSRDVVFHETIFPFSQVKQQPQKVPPSNNESPMVNLDNIEPQGHEVVVRAIEQIEHEDSSLHVQEQIDTLAEEAQTQSEDQRFPSRNRKPPMYLADYHCALARGVIDTHEGNNKENLYPISQILEYDRLQSKHRAFSIAISSMREPTTFKEAAKESHWRDAITRIGSSGAK